MILLPNQLFDIKYLPKNTGIVLYEHPHFFTKYKYNRLKLILHRASMKCYAEYLKKSGVVVKYVNYDSRKPEGVYIFSEPNNLVVAGDSPNFLLTHQDHERYFKRSGKFFFNAFYMFFKKELDILPEVKSTDKENRATIPKQELQNIPAPYKIKFSQNERDILSESVKYVRSCFPDNPGPPWDSILDNWNYAISHKNAKDVWRNFLKSKFTNFAKYQDYMYFGNVNGHSLYHSVMSSSLNIGLVNPSELIADLLKRRGNSVEAYVRQLFWREYQLYCYGFCDLTSKNYFGGKKKLSKDWFHIDQHDDSPLAICIKKAWSTGYLHHIERLMIIGNYMLLSGILPKQGFKWFMEFSIDAYEWVMMQNVYDMVFYSTGGKTMRRPYISSSNYILKMSDLRRGEWSESWDKLYHEFVKRNKHKLGYPYV